MRLRVNPRLRVIIEHVLRGASLLLLAVLLWHAVRTLDKRKEGYAVHSKLRESLASWTTRESPERAHVVVDSVPEPGLSDWMVAMNGAGTKLTWQSTNPITPGGIAVEPIAEPKHSVRVWIGASAKDTVNGSTTIMLRDGLGLIDSTRSNASGAMLTIPHVSGAVLARIGNGGDAGAIVRDSLIIRPVLVLATAGWEGKFVTSALEEYGWKTDGKFILSPEQTVIQGPPAFNIDTSRYSAVVAVDKTAGQYASSIAEYVRKGGGLIVLSEAAGSLSGLLPASSRGALVPARVLGIDSTSPRAGLALEPLTQLKSEAVVLERRGNTPVIAARRHGRGRVLQVGYIDTWRWRLGGEGSGISSGDSDAMVHHRKWWTDMLSSVAYAPRVPLPLTGSATLDPAPLATFIEKLGVQIQRPKPAADTLADPRLQALLFGILMAMLLAEWASRRLRGAR